MKRIIGKSVDLVGWTKRRDFLNSEGDIKWLLSCICDLIGMRVLKSISVNVKEDLSRKGEAVFYDEGGSSALILSTSHISFHGWSKRNLQRDDGGFFWLNICSCRDFDESEIESMVIGVLEVYDWNTVTNLIEEP
jgi:S-adenosylmethionine/arginine decarboxylase-like enzyme